MRKLFICSFILSALSLQGAIYAGVEWQAKITDKGEKSESAITTRNYALKGNIREDFIEVSGSKNPYYKKGNYFIYKANTNLVYLVDPEKKIYTELSLDDLASSMGAAGKMIQINISNPKVDVNKLADENLLSYNCAHVSINSSYDMETKIAFITSKVHVDSTHELWGAGAIFGKDLSGIYNSKQFRTLKTLTT